MSDGYGTLCNVKCPIFTLVGFPVPLGASLKLFAKMDGELKSGESGVLGNTRQRAQTHFDVDVESI